MPEIPGPAEPAERDALDPLDAARHRLALAQAELLAALVGGGPPPAGFDVDRLRVQSEALAAKRARVLAKVAPELPEILGSGYRAAARRHAERHPLTGGYHEDAVAFVRQLLADGGPADDPAVRERLTRWLGARSPARPRSIRGLWKAPLRRREER